ncbi:MAG: ABC transporter permease, partial [Kiritimatiellae bacterium]|nr:ABC transporter permease [Kiritimatiellia bacterium]
MNVIQPFVTAVTALRRNVTRSVLTMLGIVIGIAAVITMMEIGSGVKGQIETSISNMGSNMLMISPSSIRTGDVSTGSGTGITLTSAD